ncbi:MAG TPA: Dabb family protein [Candidatus Cybelea sp.]|nr:Dabb family protein [Candidatus Cybelea sp.]
MTGTKRITRAARILAGLLLAAALFAGGYVAGQNRFGQPKTIIHLVEVKWNPGVSQAQQQQVISGLKQMAAHLPGIKNIWVKADRLEPRDMSWAYAIEFRDRDAADAYAESPLHDEWERQYVPLRFASLSVQVTNP